MCSASARCTRSRSSSSVSARSNRSSSTRRPRSAASSAPDELEAVAAVVDPDAELPLDLPQVLVELPADAREAPRIVGRQHDGQRRSGLRCFRQRISAVAPATRRPLKQLRMGSVMTTSANWPTSDGGPMKLTQRWFSVRPASSRAFFLLSRSTRMRCTRADHRAADRGGLLVDERLQPLEPLLLHLVRQVLEIRGRRAGPRAVDEAERLIEADACGSASSVCSKSSSVSPG